LNGGPSLNNAIVLTDRRHESSSSAKTKGAGELLISPIRTSCKEDTAIEGNEVKCVIIVAALALAAYWSWATGEMARMNFESEPFALTKLLIRS
jgi:hypothetical protein